MLIAMGTQGLSFGFFPTRDMPCNSCDSVNVSADNITNGALGDSTERQNRYVEIPDRFQNRISLTRGVLFHFFLAFLI